jgi:hypothetical protein
MTPPVGIPGRESIVDKSQHMADLVPHLALDPVFLLALKRLLPHLHELVLITSPNLFAPEVTIAHRLVDGIPQDFRQGRVDEFGGPVRQDPIHDEGHVLHQGPIPLFRCDQVRRSLIHPPFQSPRISLDFHPSGLEGIQHDVQCLGQGAHLILRSILDIAVSLLLCNFLGLADDGLDGPDEELGHQYGKEERDNDGDKADHDHDVPRAFQHLLGLPSIQVDLKEGDRLAGVIPDRADKDGPVREALQCGKKHRLTFRFPQRQGVHRDVNVPVTPPCKELPSPLLLPFVEDDVHPPASV